MLMTRSASTALRFKIASEPSEFEQIHRLNYATFVEEIPQHACNEDRRLVDAFHPENTYVVAMRGDRLEGMMAVRGTRPFSLDAKLPDLDRHIPQGRSLCEIRLLATRRECRNGVVFRGLANTLARHALAQGYDLSLLHI